jgi:hypothetical protein
MRKRSLQAIRLSLAGLACVTWLIPVHSQAATPVNASRPVSIVRDVALDAQGRIMGQFVDAQGQPRAHQALVIQRQGGQARRASTDAQGRFVVENLSGGIYQIAAEDAAVVCRCWSANTAPPVATRQLLIVSGEGVERGQRPFVDLLSGPLLIGLVIVAAIAIPIAIHNAQDDDAS